MERPKNQARSVLLIAALTVSPVLYFFSIGPFSSAGLYYTGWLETRNEVSIQWLDPTTQEWQCAKGSPDYQTQFRDVMGCLYAPVFLLADTCEPLGEFVFWYMNLFGDG
jgi:hypothetical protein